jgi:RNA polymerase sigma-70 factor (ECF subfamily)
MAEPMSRDDSTVSNSAGLDLADVKPIDLKLVDLVGEHHAVLYRYAFRLTGSTHDAEDLTQQTFLSAQLKLDQLREAKHARGWLFTILRNRYLKNQQQRVPLPASGLELDLHALAGRQPAGVDIDREQLQRALDELSPEFKIVLMMFYFEGLAYREIAAQLELRPGTVMSRLARAKRHLRVRLAAAEFEPLAAASHRS